MPTIPGRTHAVKRIFLVSGEEVPLLVHKETGLPVILPTRWVMRKRRREVAANTLANDLQGIDDLLEWGKAHFCDSSHEDLLEFLGEGGQLSVVQLESLTTFVRERKFTRGGRLLYRSIGTASQRILSIQLFLEWAVDLPARGSGEKSNPSLEELHHYCEQLDHSFRPLRTAPSGPKRPEPLSRTEDELLREIMSPVRNPTGAFARPIRFEDINPFQKTSQIRNWLLYLLLRDCGLRRGEALKLKVDDVDLTPGNATIKILRRPDDPEDPRKPRPKVKGMEGVVPIEGETNVALRTYIQDFRHPGFRVRSGSTYLLKTRTGFPLSSSYVGRVFRIAARGHSELREVSPHGLRHTWAESLASALIQNEAYEEEMALSLLREAGRWKSGSVTPLHYIQNVLRGEANEFLRRRQDRLYKNS